MKNLRINRLIIVLQIMLTVLLLASVGLIFSACKCEHEYKREVTLPSSCSAEGEVTFTCSKCGDFYTEVLPVLEGHTLMSGYLKDNSEHWQKCASCDYITDKTAHEYQTLVSAEPSTCVEQGRVVKACVCGETHIELSPLADHSYTIYQREGDFHWKKCETCDSTTEKEDHEFTIQGSIVPSTCTVQGSSVKSCVCGDTHVDKLPFADHDYTVYQKEGNLHWQKCVNCDATTNKTAHEYTIQGAIVPSTCTKEGSDSKSCICGATHLESLPLAQHSFTKTAFNDDEHWFVCNVCNAEQPNREKVAHDFVINRTEAACEKEGKIVTTCNGCEYKNTDTLPALKHVLDESDFSKSSTGSGHYYKCNLCNKDIPVSHTLVDCECPNGYNRSATCYKGGHQDQKCEVCSWQNHFTTSRTDEHNISDEWQTDGVWHWHECTNGDGKDTCDYKEDNAQHIWEEKVIPATCTIDGRQWRECSVCGVEQGSSSKTLKATGHDFSRLVETLEEPTCTTSGVAKMECAKCEELGEVPVQKLGHDWSKYNFNEQGHWKKCATCGAEQDDGAPTRHTVDKEFDVIIVKGDCVTNKIVKHTCKYCKCEYEEVIASKGHNYVHDDPYHVDPTKFADATCTEHGWYMATCSICGDHAKIIGDVLAPHDLVYHNKKDPTDTEDGNIGYHECRTCGKYFSSGNCENELSKDSIFIYANGIEVESLSDLRDIANGMNNDETSKNFYRITAYVAKVTQKRLTISDINSETISIAAPENVHWGSLLIGDEITFKAKLYVIKDEWETLIELEDVRILSVPERDGEYTLWVESNVNDFGTDCSVQVYYGEDSDGNLQLYDINTTYYYALMPELCDDLTIYYYKNNYESNVSLIKAIVNGSAYTAQNGVIQLKVTGDMHIKLVFGTMPSTSVTLDSIDTDNNNVHIVDEYVSYVYSGMYNDYGRIDANSHLIFTVNNANIVGIVITYENYNLTGDANVLQNKLLVGADADHMTEKAQVMNEDRLKVSVYFDADNEYTRIDYFANVCQARIAEITILYRTDNTF